MTWRVRDITQTVEVACGDEKATVTIRRMSEGDLQEMQRSAAACEDLPDVVLALRRFRISHFVTTWTLPFDVSEENLLELDPSVIDKIDEAIRLFNPGVFPNYQSAESRAEKADNLAGVVESFLDKSASKKDLQVALDAFTGADAERPTGDA